MGQPMLLSYGSARVFECVRTIRENRTIARAEARDRDRDRDRDRRCGITKSDGFPGDDLVRSCFATALLTCTVM